ncbi:transposase [Salinibacter altiplanensis]|uniref:transposase n=1 Tax=Salinibacter altiplanensis TaxID=1803181 RepID=UPI001E3C41D6|nr:transposase [Salinibacter altiplanensis]
MKNIKTNDLETHLLECYLFIDDYLQSHPNVAGWRRSNNDDPDFTDAEVIVIALMQGYFRTDTLKRTYELVAANAEKTFPDRAGYKQWIRRLQRLPDQVGRLARAAALRGLAGGGRKLYAADSLPIPLCDPARYGRARLLGKDGAKFGVNASGDWFYGFKIHALIHQPTQIVITAMLLPGNRSDQVAARALARSTSGGVLLADEGYRGADLFDWLYEEAQVLRVMPSDDPDEGHSAVSQSRQQAESSFSGLWRRFCDRVYARSWHGLWTSLLLKVLHFNLKRADIASPPVDSTRD